MSWWVFVWVCFFFSLNSSKNVTSGFSLSRFSLNQQREPANSVKKVQTPWSLCSWLQSDLKQSRSKVLAWLNLWLKVILKCLQACNERVAYSFYRLSELTLEFKAQRRTKDVKYYEKYKDELLEKGPSHLPKKVSGFCHSSLFLSVFFEQTMSF